GVVEVRAHGVPPGLGSYATKEERLDARLAATLMGTQAVKGVEVGDGFALAERRGSEAHDEIHRDERGLYRETNHAGGIEGGVSNGEAIVVRAAMKPLPTLMRPLASVDLQTGETGEALVERSYTAAVEALAVVAEACVGWELAAAAREKLGGDALAEFVAAYRAYLGRIDWPPRSARPLARDEAQFRTLFEQRRSLYEQVADATADDVDDVVLAAAGVRVEVGALESLGSLVPGEAPVALVSDPHVGGIYGAAAQVALGSRLASVHEVPQGEAAKTADVLERLWSELRLDRDGTVVALGGGSTTDVGGFVAATYLRGVAWVSVPTTLVGQVDAAIGGKTAIDLSQGKNLAGAFHWPARAVIDPATLTTLPEEQHLEGMAEVVKTGLLAGKPLWELPTPTLVQRCAAYKAALCLRDPADQGERAVLNLGHTFAHALEAAAGYEGVSHGRAVALGLLAALRLSGRPTDVVEHLLTPQPVRVDRERAWDA